MLTSVGSTRSTAMMPATVPTRNGGHREAAGDPVGNKDLVGGSGASGRGLVPGHHLGAVTLADALDQGPPLGKLLGRGGGRLGRRGRRLAHADSILAIQPDPRRPRTIAQALWAQTPAAAKGVLHIRGILHVSV